MFSRCTGTFLNTNRCPYLIAALTRVRQQPPKIAQRNFQYKRNENCTIPQKLKRLWKQMFGKHLLLTNTITSALMMLVGDVLAQEIKYRLSYQEIRNYFDMRRSAHMILVGILLGPVSHYFYVAMDILWPLSRLDHIFFKILGDQFIMSPVSMTIFFYALGFMEAKSLKEIYQELSRKFWIIYTADWSVWPAAQFINFRYLNRKYRVLYISVCTTFYNVFMSFMKHDF